MKQFAKLDANGVVEHVIEVMDSNAATESAGIAFCQAIHSGNWKETSQAASMGSGIRGNYAGIGYTYMTNVATLGVASTDIFIKQKPYDSWSIGLNTATWYPPDNPGLAPALTELQEVTYKYYEWNESNYQADPSTAWELKIVDL